MGGFKKKKTGMDSRETEETASTSTREGNWRINHSINKKILRPTTTITQCQKSVEDLNRNNDYFSKYLRKIK